MMQNNKFSSASVVVCWLLLVTQHKQLVEELAGRKGLRLVPHIGNLAKHMMTLLKDGVVDQEATERARRVHDAVGAFSGTKLPMSDFVLNSFALVAMAAGSSPMAVEDAIRRLAQAHEVPAGKATNVVSRSDKAVEALTHLVEQKVTTGLSGVDVVMELIDSLEGQQVLRLTTSREQLIGECSSLLGSVAKLTGQTEARHLVNGLKFEICI